MIDVLTTYPVKIFRIPIRNLAEAEGILDSLIENLHRVGIHLRHKLNALAGEEQPELVMEMGIIGE